MIEVLTELFPIGEQALRTGFVVFLRVGAIMALLPGFGEQSVPQRIRLVLALAFTLVVAPAVATDLQPLMGQRVLIGPVLLTEVASGLALGAVFRLFVMVLQIAGSVAAQATSLSQIFGGAGVDPQPAMGHLMITAGLALAMMSGFHIRAAEAMILSYDILPAGQLPQAAPLAEWQVSAVAYGFGLAVTLAAPFLVASLIYNLALGAINRAMPQLMVAMVGAPAITAGGLMLLVLALPQLLNIWSGWMMQTLANPLAVSP